MGKITKGLAVFLILGSVGAFYSLTRPPAELEKFRTTDQAFVRSETPLPSRQGLDTLRASGSGLLLAPALEHAFKPDQSPVYVVDLRPDSLYYYRGISLRWFGLEVDPKAKTVIQRTKKGDITLKKRFNALGQDIKWRLRQWYYGATPNKLTLADLESEASMVGHLHFGYINIEGDRHTVHTDAGIDKFLGFVKTLPPKAWVHFHCGAGRGRTTIFMTLYDIYRNGRTVSLYDIIRRQYLLGGEDMFDTKPWANGTWTAESLQARKHLMENFYLYVNDPEGLGVTPWSVWHKRTRSNATPIL